MKFLQLFEQAKALQQKVQQIHEKMPEWVASGGNPDQIAPLGQKIGELMQTGNVEEAEKVVDLVLAIVTSSTAESEAQKAPTLGVEEPKYLIFWTSPQGQN